MPPRVMDYVERDLIPVSSTDTALLVFVEQTGELQIWNGIQWETIHALSTVVQTVAQQDFDTNLNWSYTYNPGFYSVGVDHWNILDDLGTGTAAIDRVNGNFLGCRDLNNANGGGSFYHQIAFTNVDISTLANVRIAFDYDIFEFDNGDDVVYEVFFDDIAQGVTVLLDGASNLTAEGTEVISVPPGVGLVRLTLGVIQNGDGDFAGFDRFRVYGE